MMSHIKENKNLELIEADAFNIPLEKDHVDLTVSLDFISHFKDWENILLECLRVKKNNGFIIFNYLPKEHITLINKQNTIAKYPKAYSELIEPISEEQLFSLANKYNYEIIKIKPYRFFANNEIFRTLIDDNSCDLMTERYNQFYKKNDRFLEKLTSIEQIMTENGDCSICSSAIVVIKVKK